MSQTYWDESKSIHYGLRKFWVVSKETRQFYAACDGLRKTFHATGGAAWLPV